MRVLELTLCLACPLDSINLPQTERDRERDGERGAAGCAFSLITLRSRRTSVCDVARIILLHGPVVPCTALFDPVAVICSSSSSSLSCCCCSCCFLRQLIAICIVECFIKGRISGWPPVRGVRWPLSASLQCCSTQCPFS